MVEKFEKITREVDPATVDQRHIHEVHETTEVSASPTTVLARLIKYITGLLLALLAFRFALAAAGANPANGFADFIYSVSHPFVAPFFSLFNYRVQHGVSRIEVYTLFAMGVYALIGYGLARLTTIGHASHSGRTHHAV